MSQQDEAANAHWGQAQVSMLTSAIWCTRLMRSFFITSDDMTHAKETRVQYVDRLFHEIPEGIEVVQCAYLVGWKNTFITIASTILQEKYNIKLYWNFFPTALGKGAVDVIGGALKRQVWVNV